MAKKAEYQPGQALESWSLVEYLGAGGNAEVWKAQRGSQTVALKILHQKKVESEPYRRFRAEIGVLRKLGGHTGVLPLLDASLPDRPSRSLPAWLAIPLARPVRDVLGMQPALEAVIDAVARYASTLANLAANHKIYHRDLKPENLYSYENEWCLGDFGLVDYPDKEDLTAPGKWIGPIYYLAPELLVNPDSAESGPADVYSLAKTLWVLASGQNYPIPGELRADMTQTRISSRVASTKSYDLDLLLERCTQLNPADRPRMEEVAAELAALRARPSTPLLVQDLSDLKARFLPIVRRCTSGAERQRNVDMEIDRLMEHIALRLASMESEIRKATALHTLISSDNHINSIVEHPPLPKLKRSLSANVVIRDPRLPSEINTSLFVSGIGVLYGENGDISLAAAHGIRDKGDKLLWSKLSRGSVATARLKQEVENLLTELMASLPKALHELATYLDANTS